MAENSSRQRQIMRCHSRATAALKKIHADEYGALVAREFAADGLEVRPRRSRAQVKADRQAKIDEHKAGIESLNQ